MFAYRTRGYKMPILSGTMARVDDSVILAVRGPVATVTINRPIKRNALTREVLERLLEMLEVLDHRDDLRTLMLKGAGESFCAGLDLHEMFREREVHGTVEHELLQQVFNRLDHHSNPSIAVVQGAALAGGCELALHCDIRIAAPMASFGMPLARVGLVVPFRLAQRITDIVGVAIARELLFTGEPIDGTRAFQIGLVSRLVPADDLSDAAQNLAQRIAANAPLAIRETKRVLRRTVRNEDLLDDPELEEARRRISRSDDVREGLQAFLQRREPAFRGA